VLAVVGENSAPTFPERRELLCSWLPKVELFELPGATHLLHLENPQGMAEGLASFFARHPIPGPYLNRADRQRRVDPLPECARMSLEADSERRVERT
jgi:hypothetical protein